jgi:hypothetical protein
MTEPSSVDRQSEHLGNLLRAFEHIHTDECMCVTDTEDGCESCTEQPTYGGCPERCEHSKTLQSLRTTHAGESA